MKPQAGTQAGAGQTFRPDRKEPYNPFGIFRTSGTIAVVCGAVSFVWLFMRKKLTSPSRIVKWAGQRLNKLHTVAGWVAVVLVVAHGTYYMILKFNDHNTYSGLAAFVVMMALAVYGYNIRRVRNKYVRVGHRLLSYAWLPLLAIHAGGSFFGTAAGTAGFFAAVWALDRYAKRTAPAASAG